MQRIARWAEGKANIRGVRLTGSRATPGAPVDALSDWDVILYASDPAALLNDRSWPSELGSVLVQLPPKGQEQAWNCPTRLVLYEDGTKIDFTILGADAPVASAPDYVLRPPTQEAFSAVVEEFWWETSYVAKNLWRDELLPAKYSLECVLQLDLLRRMLEWSIALDHGWSYAPGVMGRGFKRHLDATRWKALEETFAGAEIDDNWRALWQAIGLFRSAATELARRLALEYPHDLDAKMTRYLEEIRTSSRDLRQPHL